MDTPETLIARLEALAYEHHKAVDGEYGCGWPQTRCPGVLRLVDFAQREVRMTLLRLVGIAILSLAVEIVSLPVYALCGAVDGVRTWWRDFGFVFRALKG